MLKERKGCLRQAQSVRSRKDTCIQEKEDRIQR